MNNREIKFRIWDNHTKHFATCVYETNKDCYLFIGRSGYVTAFNCYGEEIDFHGRFIIQQYTGLKDSKGVEIYEGDIVAEKFTEEMAANGDSATVGVVYFAAGTFMIDGDGPLYDRTHSLTPDILEDFIVVGNVFENPELLKQ